MEPVELETIMRNRAGNGSAGNSQNPSGMEQSMDTFTAGYDKQIETVKQLEQQLESLKTKLDSLPSGALSKGLNAGMGLAVTNLENAKRALTDLNKIVSAGTTAADLFGAQQQKIATIEATLQSVMTLTNGVLTVYESTIKKSGPIHEILILAKEKLALANVKLARTVAMRTLFIHGWKTGKRTGRKLVTMISFPRECSREAVTKEGSFPAWLLGEIV